ncbi:hypothetical protein yaldo0001_8260 [Yersinia aldovae ATCC 35236]|nr:hypothetical protein yaldo0001_8260 [Yersinia aldovae ATCC 35236]
MKRNLNGAKRIPAYASGASDQKHSGQNLLPAILADNDGEIVTFRSGF